MAEFKTSKGTTLPMTSLKGKDYLEVKWRAVWFREEKPAWTIQTEIKQYTPDHALVRAEILDETGRVVQTGHKQESKKDFPDFLEKAETGAVGRALGLLGYGTQFAPEFDEGDRIADAPVQRVQTAQAPNPPAPKTRPRPTRGGVPGGDYLITFGKFQGQTLGAVGIEEARKYVHVLEAMAKKAGKPLSQSAMDLKAAVARLEHDQMPVAEDGPPAHVTEDIPF